MRFFLLLLLLTFSACAGVTGTGNPCAGSDCVDTPAGEVVPGYSNTNFGIAFARYSFTAHESGVTSEPALSGGGTEQVLTVQLADGAAQTMTVEARKLNADHVLSSLLTQLYPGAAQNVFSGTHFQGYWLLDPDNAERIYFFLAQQTLVSMHVHVLDESGVYEAIISSLEIE